MYPSPKKTCQVSIWKSVEFMRLRATDHSIFSFYVCITSLVLLNTEYKNPKVCTTVSSLQVCISASDTIHRNWQLLHFNRVSLTESMEEKIPSSFTLLRSTTQARGHLLLDSNTKHAQNKTTLLPCQTQWNNTHQSQHNFASTYLTNWCLFFVKDLRAILAATS